MTWGRRSGVTLVEVLIAVAIIGAIFTVLALTQVQTLRITSDSREASDATSFANEALEQQVGRLLEIDTFRSTLEGGETTTSVGGDGRFQGTITVRPVGSGYLEAGLLEVAIEMTEPDRVSFSRWVSCLDVDDPPSVANPDPCPDAS